MRLVRERRGRYFAPWSDAFAFAVTERAARGSVGGGSMQFPATAGTNGRPASRSRSVGARSELESLRATCRSQALRIDARGQAVCALRRGAAALKAENADLRTERDRLRSGRR